MFVWHIGPIHVYIWSRKISVTPKKKWFEFDSQNWLFRLHIISFDIDLYNNEKKSVKPP